MRSGFSLIELIVTLAVLGIMIAVAGVAMNRTQSYASTPSYFSDIEYARAQAIRSGRAARITVVRDGRKLRVLALPDGLVIADTSLPVDMLTGRPRALAP